MVVARSELCSMRAMRQPRHLAAAFLPPLLRVSLIVSLASPAACGHADDKAAPDPSKAPSAAESRGFVVTEVKPGRDALFSTLQSEIKKARSQGLKPYVEFSAGWCEPCMAIKHSLDDPRMKAAFKGAYIIQLDADDWVKNLEGTGFSAGSIPVFYEVGDDGKPTGRKIDGGAWGDNIPENMAPPLGKFFHGS